VKFKLETEFQDTEIGEIPKDWKIVKLKDVAEIRRSKKVPQGMDKVVFIPMEAIPDDSIYTKFELRDINEVKSYVYCEPGDILLAKITPSFENGKQGIVPLENSQKFALATTEVYPIKGKKIDTFFLFYLLKYPSIRDKLTSLMRGTTGRKRVPREALENQWIPLPPAEEQKKISEILLTVDKALENVDNAIARLERLKKALMSELLTGRIRIKEENGKLVFYRETEFQDTEIGEIPKDWKIVKLGNVAKYVKGKKPKNLFEEKIDNDLLPYLTAEYMRGLEKPKWCDPKLEKSIIKVSSDDIIMIWDGSYAGHVFIGFEGILASTMVKITPIRDIEKRFLFYYLAMNYKKLRETTIGTGIPHINKKVFEEFPIPLPPVDEQRRIAEILATIDKTIELHHEEKARLDRLKRGLMDLLLTGRVRVVG
jgi:type I restriction enzyme S subunit